MMRAVRFGFAWLLALVAALSFGPVFGGFPGHGAVVGVLFMSCVVTVLPGVVALLMPRLPSALVALVGALGVAITAATTSGAGRDMITEPAMLINGALPAEPTGSPLAAAGLIAGWCCLLGVLLAVYADNPLVPVLPPLVCLTVALSLGGSVTEMPGWYGLALVAVVAGLLFSGRTRRPSIEQTGAAVLAGVLVICATTLLGPVLPHAAAPAEAQALFPTPIEPRSGVSPLQQYPAMRDGKFPVHLEVTSTAPAERLRLATLTHFDGSFWTIASSYRRAAHQLPALRLEGHPVTVTQQVQSAAGGWPLGWLVAAGRPRTLNVSGMGVDTSTGDVAVPAGTTPPTSYSVTSTVNRVSAVEVGTAAVSTASHELLTPSLPNPLRDFVRKFIVGETTRTGRLMAIYRQFTASRSFSYDEAPNAPGGHGYYHIQRLLTKHRGTSEQYASTFAVMARYLGIDARVVMGFTPPQHSRTSFRISGGDVDAWVEVHFSGLGWVSLDPSPRNNRTARRTTSNFVPPSVPKTTDPLDIPTSAPQQRPSRSASTGLTSPVGTNRPVAAILAWALPTVLLAALLAAPLAKSIRRSRRRRATNARWTVLGAWWETLDRLRETGASVSRASSTGDIVPYLPPTPESRRLAFLADAAAYAPEPPDVSLIHEAWQLSTSLQQRVSSGLSPVHRLKAFLDPRPLLPTSSQIADSSIERFRSFRIGTRGASGKSMS